MSETAKAYTKTLQKALKDAECSAGEVDGIYGQQTLTLLGYWDAPVDGVWTEELTDAVKEFQKELGVEPTGEVDAATVKAFQDALAKVKDLVSSSPSAEPSPDPTATTEG